MELSRIKGLQTSLQGRYATALFEVALEQSQSDFILSGLQYFALALKEEQALTKDLSHLDAASFAELINECTAQFSWPAYLNQFFKLLHQAKRLTLLPEIIAVFETLSDHAFNRMAVRLTVPAMPTESQKKKLESKVVSMFGKEIRYEYESIPSILGGFVLSTNDSIQIDASVSSKLDQLKNTLNDSPLKGAA